MRFTEKKTIGATAGNATSVWTNSTGRLMQLVYAEQRVTTDATVANRYGKITLKDSSGNEVFDSHAGAAITASLTGQHIQYMAGIYRETALTNGAVEQPIPHNFVIPPGYTVTFSLTNGVAGDSWTADAMFMEV